jgi:hypothetical protein
MASLRSMILGGRFAQFKDLTAPQQEIDRRINTRVMLNLRDCTLIKATNVATELITASDDELFGWEKIPRPKPPFHGIWLEAAVKGQRVGAFVKRTEINIENLSLEQLEKIIFIPAGLESMARTLKSDRPTSLIEIIGYTEAGSGEPAFAAEAIYWIDANGDYQHGSTIPWPPPKKQEDRPRAIRAAFSFKTWAMHAFARMNCHNVKLLPAKGGQPRVKPGAKHAPFSVWHEIVVTDSPAARRARIADPVDAEKHAVRLHKVRGHFADYRKGAGLFGRYKVLIWVDEHEAGDAELGSVVSTYKVD